MTDKKLKDFVRGYNILQERERQYPTISTRIDRKTLLSIDTIKHLYHLDTRGEAIIKLVQDAVIADSSNPLNKFNFDGIYKKLMKKE